MKIVVRIPQVVTRESGLKNKDGSYAVDQTVLLVIDGKLAPLESSVLLRAGSKPFEVGDYEVDSASFSSGNYGSVNFRLRVGPKIVPAVAVEPARKAA